MDQALILEQSYIVGSGKVPIWVTASGSDDAIGEIKIHASRPRGFTKPVCTGSAAKKLSKWLTAYFAGNKNGKPADLPLDESTYSAHHRKCMRFLRSIPFGQTRTYKQEADAVAGRIANPSARAAGQANSRNLFPLVIPCHRIVSSSAGSARIGGFMGGTKQRSTNLKRALLVHEGAQI